MVVGYGVPLSLYNSAVVAQVAICIPNTHILVAATAPHILPVSYIFIRIVFRVFLNTV